MSNKEKQIKIRLEEWKYLHKIISYFVDTYGVKLSNAQVIEYILKYIKKEDVIQWTKQSLKN